MISSRLWHVGLFGILFVLILVNVGFADTVDTVTSCSVSESGYSIDIKNTITLINSSGKVWTIEDKCAGSASVKAAFCDNSANEKFSIKFLDCSGKGYSCKDGACVAGKNSCSDTDNGQDLTTKGTVTATGGDGKVNTSTDYCPGLSPSKTVIEMSCNANNMNVTTWSDCPSGTSCKEGACVAQVTNTCSDNDPTQDITIKGTMSGTNSSGEYSQYDFCSGSDYINQYACKSDNSGGVYSQSKCSSGTSCKDGACVKPDSTPVANETPVGDGSSTPAVTCKLQNSPASSSKKNTVTCTDGLSVTDYCLDTKNVVDYSVSKNKLVNKTIKCSTGKSCKDGACVKSSSGDEGAGLSCTDSDGGISTAIKGSISYKEMFATEPTVEYDSCKNPLTVYEKYCLNNKPKTKTVKCPAYMVCTDGACVDEDTAASNDTSGELKKKSPLREFLMAAGFDDYAYLYAPSTDAKSRMAKSWKIGKGNILSEIFMYDFEPIEIANPPE